MSKLKFINWAVLFLWIGMLISSPVSYAQVDYSVKGYTLKAPFSIRNAYFNQTGMAWAAATEEQRMKFIKGFNSREKQRQKQIIALKKEMVKSAKDYAKRRQEELKKKQDFAKQEQKRHNSEKQLEDKQKSKVSKLKGNLNKL